MWKFGGFIKKWYRRCRNSQIQQLSKKCTKSSIRICVSQNVVLQFSLHKSAKIQLPGTPSTGSSSSRWSKKASVFHEWNHMWTNKNIIFWGSFCSMADVDFNARPQEVHRESIGGSWTISKPHRAPCRIILKYFKELNTSWLEMKPCTVILCHASLKLL